MSADKKPTLKEALQSVIDYPEEGNPRRGVRFNLVLPAVNFFMFLFLMTSIYFGNHDEIFLDFFLIIVVSLLMCGTVYYAGMMRIQALSAIENCKNAIENLNNKRD